LPSNLILPPLTLNNLDVLNQFGTNGSNVYLTSKDDVSKDPVWLRGIVPEKSGRVTNAKTCVVIIADKGNGVVDAFFIMFWAFNWGGIFNGENLGKIRNCYF
jgi:hypothetical protein